MHIKMALYKFLFLEAKLKGNVEPETITESEESSDEDYTDRVQAMMVMKFLEAIKGGIAEEEVVVTEEVAMGRESEGVVMAESSCTKGRGSDDQ